MGFVLGAVPVLAEISYQDIPARRWSWDQVRQLPDGPGRIDRELRRQGEYDRRWHTVHEMLGPRHISKRKHAFQAGAKALDGIGPASAAAVAQDTLNVLIIRIAFEENRDPHLTTVDPTGDFVLVPDPDPEPIPIDPPPRNKTFYESHLTGLSEYYRYQSGSRLHIEGRVLPEGENDSYKLSDLADYGPGAGNFWSLESLEALVRDMMIKADEETQRDGSANLADFGDGSDNSYIIFVHAGSDWQSDINGDSPNDIPTFFVTLGEPQSLIGTGPDGQPGQLSERSVIPETTNQDGYPGSIAAAFYHEFGHALGLPDVYSTGNGTPTAGIWDLMDSGTNLPVLLGTITDVGDTVVISATGVLPPSLSVWCKDFLGWVKSEVMDSRPGDFRLPAVGVPRDQYWLYDLVGDFDTDYPQVYRAGVSDRDYFLLENRWVPPGPADTPYDSLSFERDEVTGVIQYLAGYRAGAWSNSGLYDYFLPSGGLLVWHVHGDRVASGLPNNVVNYFGDGLRLVEADGIDDIGVINAYVLGWFGSWRDPFGGFDLDGNPTGFDQLHVDGFPSSRGYDRSWTGLSLWEISPDVPHSASVMKFKGTVDPILPSFPRVIPQVTEEEVGFLGGAAGPRRLDTRSLTPVTLGGGSQQVLIFADRPTDDYEGIIFPGTFYNLWSDGVSRWSSVDDKPEGAFEFLGGVLVGPPAVHDRPDGDHELVFAVDKGRVRATLIPDDTSQPTRRWTTTVGDSLLAGPVPLAYGDQMRWLCAVHPDQLVLLDSEGGIFGPRLDLSGGAGGLVTDVNLSGLYRLDRDHDRALVLAGNGWFLVRQDENGLVTGPAFYPYDRIPDHTPEWTAPREGDPGIEVHVFDSEGQLGAWLIDDANMVAESDGLDLDEPLVTAPAVADLDGDGHDDLVLASRERIYAFKADGVHVRGYPARYRDLFPLPDSTGISGPLVVADGNGDGLNEVYFATDGGHLLAIGPTGKLLPRMPFRWGDRVGGSFALGGPDADRVLWLLNEGGATAAPLDRNLVNGQVAAYGLAGVSPAAERSTEWLGMAGGVARRGPVGSPHDLGGMAPAAADRDLVFFYPNPVSGDGVTVRFFSSGSDPAQVAIFNLEGEQVTSAMITVTPDAVNEHFLPLPVVASGMYLARIRFTGPDGIETRTLTLAVEK